MLLPSFWKTPPLERRHEVVATVKGGGGHMEFQTEALPKRLSSDPRLLLSVVSYN